MQDKAIETAKEDRINKAELLELKNRPKSKYALFVRSPTAGSAKFRFAFEDIEEAKNKAQEYFVNRVANGKTDFTFYIVELKHMIGIENGTFVDKEIP